MSADALHQFGHVDSTAKRQRQEEVKAAEEEKKQELRLKESLEAPKEDLDADEWDEILQAKGPGMMSPDETFTTEIGIMEQADVWTKYGVPLKNFNHFYTNAQKGHWWGETGTPDPNLQEVEKAW